MQVVRLYNPANRDVHTMYDGTPYVLPARGVAYVPLVAAEHFMSYYESLGLRILGEGEEVPSAGSEAQEQEPEAEEESDTTVCDICGKDFSDKERPTVALKRHKIAAHGTAKTADI